MDISFIKNFLLISRLGNMTRASQMLHITQSALSKQVKALEQEFGRKLIVKEKNHLSLTEEGLLLRERAADLISLYEKTRKEFDDLNAITGGDIHIGAAETCHMDIFARELIVFRKKYPNVHCHILSGLTEQITERMDRGLIDLAIISGVPDFEHFNHILYPASDQWGIVVRRDHFLADMEHVGIDDLKGLDLIMSPQGLSEELSRWCADRFSDLQVSHTVNLTYNGTVLVKENFAVCLTYKGLTDTSEENGLKWIPLYPELRTPLYLIWRKYQILPPIVDLFLKQLEDAFLLQSDSMIRI